MTRIPLGPSSCVQSFRVLLAAALAAGLFAATAPAAGPLAQDYTVVFHNTDPEYYVEGCGLVHLDDGAFVAVVPIVPRLKWSEARRVEHSVIHLVRSTDAGKTWQPASDLPYYSAIPFVHQGVLYLFANTPGTKFRNDDLLLLRSPDGGKTWSKPVTLFKGHFWNCHTGLVVANHHIYAATDDLSHGANRGPVVVSGDLTKDLMDPASWRISNPVPFPGVPDALVNPKFSKFTSQYLEPNMVNVQGQLKVLATVKPKRQTTANISAVLDLNDDGQKLDLKFSQFASMPGGQLKFCVLWDETTKMFWATANLVADSQGTFDWWSDGAKEGNYWGEGRTGGNDRRFLMLLYSVNALDWFQAGCIARAPKVSQSFMYARPVIDGDDLAIISRSSVNAPNQHDADYATFHRLKNFRSLALDLRPSDEK